jgi:alkanesulfonate monooxygenase SsuD/methylene tetrahydromethanopterin reductase-like flavin-dependent oxidoreductase (luciferase family)
VDRLEEAVQIIASLMTSERTTFDGRYYHLDDAPLEPKPLQRPRIPLLIAAHRPRMIRLAARYADQWDTFPELPGTATDGVTEGIDQRVRRFDSACNDAGRDPVSIRRSTWVGPEIAADEDAYLSFARRHRALGFTDFMTQLPGPSELPALRRIARERIPELRAEFATIA